MYPSKMTTGCMLVILLVSDVAVAVAVSRVQRSRSPCVSSKDCLISPGSSRTSCKLDLVSLCAVTSNNARVAALSVTEGLLGDDNEEEDCPRYRKVDVFRGGDDKQ